MTPSEKLFTGSYKGQTAIICGSAPCLLDEYPQVKNARPDAVTIGINEAVSAFHCDLLMTAHVLEIPYFQKVSLSTNIESHTSKPYYKDWADKADYFWPDIDRGATSTIDAVQIALRMEFDEVILVGAPMNGGDGYFNIEQGKNARETEDGCPRFGNDHKDENFFAQKYKTRLEDIVSSKNFDKVSSMSGFTQEIFGKPKL